MDNLETHTSTTGSHTSVIKKIVVIAILIIAGAAIFFAATKNNSSPTASVANPYEVSLAQIDKNTQSGSPLIDVRTPEEYAAQHAKGAINLPLVDIQNGKMPNVAKDKIVYVYCHSGARAAQAKTRLEKDGYQHVISLGGIGNWIALGGQVVPPLND